jgi:hypothetical protein
VRKRIRATLRRVHNAALVGFGLTLAVPLRLISRVYRVEIQKLLSERIGHFALEPELLLCRRTLASRQRRVTFFFVSGPVCNEFLLLMWRRVLHVGPSWLLKPIAMANALLGVGVDKMP